MKWFRLLISVIFCKSVVLGVPGPLQPAEPHEFPFQVSFGTIDVHYCSGAILNQVRISNELIKD